MNERSSPMDELQREHFEKQITAVAKDLAYPRTPNVAASVLKRLSRPARPRLGARRLAWALTAIVVLFASLMLIPPARAAILDFIQVGIVRIFRAEPAPPHQQAPLTATPASTAAPLIPLLERLAGEMTFEEAQQTVGYPILLPSYPPDLGPPDRIFVQDAAGDMTILVWIDPQQPDRIRMSLHLIPPQSWAVDKMDPALVEETTVNGRRAIWTTGPYPLRFSNGDLDFIRMIEGHVLIWTEGEMTYRLETRLSREEAVRVAESLEPAR